jgi:polyphosphate kinase
VYGVFGYKTHAKMAMIVRREETGLCRYVHLGTGNYHSRTTKQYTDFGLFTCHPEICADVNEVFLQITGLGNVGRLQHLFQSPFDMQSRLIAAIHRETEHARAGRPARIIAKMNALTEPGIIEALYEASQAGVRSHLVVRGICTLRPGIQGMSENIRVRSIIGRFLEHSRIFYFRNHRKFDVYIASADWMERNFFRRIEVCVPILDLRLKRRVVREGLHPYLRDNGEAWEMNADGEYVRIAPRRGEAFNAQHRLLAALTKSAPP